MDFDRRKLAREEGAKLKPLKVDSMQPFTLLPAPVYVFFPRNAKYVSVKGPLDFFSPEELKKFYDSGSLFFPAFIDQVLPFRDAGVRCRAILSWQPVQRQESATGGAKDVAIPPSPFEISDALIRIVGPLWGKEGQLEPFFAVSFAEELCESLPEGELAQARDENVEAYEQAILISSLTVFLAIHLGWCDLAYLNGLRLRIFRQFSKGLVRLNDPNPDVVELVRCVSEAIRASGLKPINQKWFSVRSDRISSRISSRLNRVFAEYTKDSGPAPSIFGEGGFLSG
jgi:hypothetical protein